MSVCAPLDTGPVHTWIVLESALLLEGLTSPLMMERPSPSVATVTTSSLRSVSTADDPDVLHQGKINESLIHMNLFTEFILQSENWGYYKGCHALFGVSYNPFFPQHSNDSDIAVVGNLAKCDPARKDTCLNSITLIISGTTVSALSNCIL